MSTTLDIRNGPGKADLLRSVTNVAKGLTTLLRPTAVPLRLRSRASTKARTVSTFCSLGMPHHPSSAAFHFGESITSKRRRGG